MEYQNFYRINKLLIALIWVINGLFCKILGFVPRHQEIVGTILKVNETMASVIIFAIGILEVLMAIWILSGYKSKLNAILQISIVTAMNILEFLFASELLLWGKFNALFALAFVLLVYGNEFILNKNNRYALFT